jgi:hypothetical protein
VATRVRNILEKKVFKVQAAHVERAEVQGMEHVAGVPAVSAEECKQLAARLYLTKFDVSTPQGLARLARLSTIYQQNPEIVNTALDDQTRGLYF